MKFLQQPATRRIRIIDGLSIGTRERVVLLGVDDQKVLVGISPGGMRPLHVFASDATENFNELLEKCKPHGEQQAA
jgi:flagellar protein FliO/FliZ